MWRVRRYIHNRGLSSESRIMYFAHLEHCCSDGCYHDTYSTYRLELPEKRQSKKAKLGTKLLRVRLILPRVRIRIISPSQVLEKVRDSYLRLVLSHKKHDDNDANSLHHYHHQASYSSDAVADCIEFIKRSSSTVSQDDRFL